MFKLVVIIGLLVKLVVELKEMKVIKKLVLIVILLTIPVVFFFDWPLDFPSWKYRCFKVTVDAGIDVPPMPDCRENNKTLAGIDSDKDGVRDDIQRYIAAIDIDHPYYKRGLTQFARALQKTILEHDQEDMAQKNFDLQGLAIDCESSAILDTQNPYTPTPHGIELEDLQRNTIKRRLAYRKWHSYIEPQIVPSRMDRRKSCNFDINKFSGERKR